MQKDATTRMGAKVEIAKGKWVPQQSLPCLAFEKKNLGTAT